MVRKVLKTEDIEKFENKELQYKVYGEQKYPINY